MIPSYILTPGINPKEESLRRRAAYALMAQGSSGEPVQHWTQGLARMAQGALGGYEIHKDKEEENSRESRIMEALTGLPGLGGQQNPALEPVPPSAPMAEVPKPRPNVVAALNPSGVASDAPPVAMPPPAPPMTGNRPPVAPGPKVWGDKEAEDAGIYPPSNPNAVVNDRFAAVPPAQPGQLTPRPVQTERIAQALQPARQAPTIPADEQANIKRLLANPATRPIGMQRYQELMKPKDQSRPMTPEERKAFGVPEHIPASIDMATNKPAYGPAGTSVTTNVGGGSDKQIFDTMDTRANEARTIAAGLTGLREARAAIQGGAITGAAANQVLGLQKIGAALGISNSDKIVNTETFRAAIAPQVAAVLKSTVGTANISNTDREFAEKAAGGNITLDEKSITRLLDIMEKASLGKLTGHQKTLERVYPDAEKHARERALFGVEMPAEIPPPVATQAPPQAPAQAPKVRRYNPATGKIE
jgi:hypothetical protein